MVHSVGRMGQSVLLPFCPILGFGYYATHEFAAILRRSNKWVVVHNAQVGVVYLTYNIAH